MRRTVFAIACPVLLIPPLLASAPAAAAAPVTPSSITSVSSRPGPGVGQVTVSWKSTGAHTTGFVLQTALNTFTKTDGLTPGTGRRARLTPLGRTARSVTLSAAAVNSLGAGVASGNALFFRLYAVNRASSGTSTRAYPYQQAVVPRPAAPKATGTKLRVASFNVRTARATTDSRTWLQRAPDVAAEIVSHAPGVVALQELGPGRADGKTGTTQGTPRQTTSLLTALAKVGGQRYQLTRTTPYVASGLPSGTQGMRILYDTSRYTLVNSCPETTGSRAYSPACSLTVPKLASDSESERRRAALAKFRDRRTGKLFWFASVHLDARHSTNVTTERSYDALRLAQINAVNAGVAHFNPQKYPVIIGGDFNSWQNSKVASSAHDRLVSLGYYDTSAAVTRVNFSYTTYTAFKTTVPPASHKIGVRLDMMMVKGATGAQRFENVMKATDSSRPSDHNLILSDIVL